MSVEQLLFLFLFVLIPLFNVLRKVLRKRQPAPPLPETRPVESMPALPPPRKLHPVPALVHPPARATTAERRPAPVAEPRRRRPYLAPSDVRRGIVIMTILGPCRALEPEAAAETRG